jgi:hypothetical protein
MSRAPLIDLRDHVLAEQARASETPWRDLGAALARLAWVAVKSLLVVLGIIPNPRVRNLRCACCESRDERWSIWVESSR